jgi:hypothetical protein
MRERIDIPVDRTVPPVSAVLRGQGIPGDRVPDRRISRLAGEAAGLYRRLARPAGLLGEISREAFAAVYTGEGRNERETPLDLIYPQGEHLALFAVTVGAPVSEEITRLFDAGEPALGAMLDVVASEATEAAANDLADHYRNRLRQRGRLGRAIVTLPFSPGYCGWHVSGQRRLFAALDPGEVGITLSDSFLMCPLKSISGVIVAGPQEIFTFDPTFFFCDTCRTRTCEERLGRLLERGS